MIKTWRIIAFPEVRRRLGKKEIVIQAFDSYEAIAKGRKAFPEYYEIGICEIKNTLSIN